MNVEEPPSEATSPDKHTRHLANELLGDLEFARVSGAQLVLKVSRLARLVGNQETIEWLRYEMYGYTKGELSEKYMDWTGRWTNKDDREGYWQGLGQIEATIDTLRARLDTLRLPDISSDYAATALREIRGDTAATSAGIAALEGVRSKVLALIHRFVTDVHYEWMFSARQETMFEDAKSRIDSLLAPLSGDALNRIESIYQRLREGDPEAISQALNTCRRLMDGFADAVYPPADKVLEVEGKEVKLTAQHHQNRINAFIRDNCHSQSRRKRLRRRLNDLYERVTTGVHADVSVAEAQFLFLDTYLLLGEILELNREVVERAAAQRVAEPTALLDSPDDESN